jgi:hypothetical protein
MHAERGIWDTRLRRCSQAWQTWREGKRDWPVGEAMHGTPKQADTYIHQITTVFTVVALPVERDRR